METITQTKKTVLLGITGGIAAYKAAELVRVLQKRGLDVMCVMTRHATEFIGAVTLRALTGYPVALDDFENPSAPMRHLNLAQSCDVFAVVPATANVVAKLAWGVADDLLTTTAVATKAPLVVAPAMNTAMWQSEQNQKALRILKERGVAIVEPASGYLACGETGEGKLATLDVIADAIEGQLAVSEELTGKTALITSGPTREKIDDVRYLSNESSGAMGFALARQAKRRGARVIVVSGPTALYPPRGVEVYPVTTAEEMLEVGRRFLPETDILIGAAAVADYRLAQPLEGKHKKDGSPLVLNLVENPDVIAMLSKELKAARPAAVSVGFAAEYENLIENARAKLIKKHLDFVVANDISRKDIGFNTENNEVSIISTHKQVDLPKSSKEDIASGIIETICSEGKDA